MSTVRNDVDVDVIVKQGVSDQTVATDTTKTSASIDMHDYPGYRVLLVGYTGSRTDGSFTFAIQQSDDDSSYGALAALSGTMTATAAANTVKKASYVPTKRYVQTNCVSTGTTSGAVVGSKVFLIPPYGCV